MRKLLWLVVIAAALWSGYWYLGARGLETGLGYWLEERRGEGWQAEATQISTSGFPVGVETVIRDIELVDPETGLGWSAPSFRFTAPLHAPTRVQAVWPEKQKIVTPYETIEVTAGAMEGALGLIPGPSLALDTSDITIADLGLRSNKGWTASLGAGSLTSRRLDERSNAYEITFSAENLRPARRHLLELDPTGRAPKVVEAMDVQATIDFDAPWDRHAIEVRRPQPVVIDLKEVKAQWGDMELEAAGLVNVSENGIPDGKITIRAVNWKEMVAIARRSGALPEGIAPTVERALGGLAGLSGNRDTIDAPLTFAGGLVLFGPIPLGPAPVIRLR